MIKQHRRRAWLSEALTLASLALLPLLFWWRLWAVNPADRAVIPAGDFTSQYLPLQLFAARELAAGRLPAWNPYLNAGQPGLADIQTGTFYPLNLVPNLVLAASGRPYGVGLLTAQVVLHFSLASLFTYLFVRNLARQAGARVPAARFAGAVSALSFTYAGYLTSFPVQQITILETCVWLPLILLCLDLARVRPARLGWLLAAAGALACALLAGHPQTAMYVVYATLAYGFLVAWGAGCRASAGRRVLSASLSALIPIGVGAALAAIQLVPTLAFILRSTRAGLDYDTVAWGFPLAEMTHFLYPGYFGGSPQYIGILPPILAAAAFLLAKPRRRVLFWSAVALVALLLAFGGHTFAYNVAYLLAPGFGAVRNQERIVYLFSFAVSILAGYGALGLVQPLSRPARPGFRRLARVVAWTGVVLLGLTALFYFGYLQGLQEQTGINLFEGVLRHQTLLLLILGGSALLLALRQKLGSSRRWLMALCLGLLWLNLFTVNWRFNLADPPADGPFPETLLVAYLQEQAGTWRISSAGLLPGGASAGVIYELEDITANTPLRLGAFQQFQDQLGSWQLWQLLNVHYVLDTRELDGPGLTRIFEEGEVKLYRISTPLPRAWVVHNLIAADGDQALALLAREDFDAQTTAVVSTAASIPATGSLSAGGGDGVESSARVLKAMPGSLLLDVATGADGLLVVSQPFYPGWQARVDGTKTTIHHADFMLQGIPIRAGQHRVEITYRLALWPALVSLTALLGCAAGLALARRRA
jgi:hypothetical protein